MTRTARPRFLSPVLFLVTTLLSWASAAAQGPCSTGDECGSCQVVASGPHFGYSPIITAGTQTTFTVVPFRPTPGQQLRKVSITAFGSHVARRFQAENQDPDTPCPCDEFAGWEISSVLQVYDPSGVLLLGPDGSSDVAGDVIQTMARYDHVTDFGLTGGTPNPPCGSACVTCADPCVCESGITINYPDFSSPAFSTCISDPAQLLAWIDTSPDQDDLVILDLDSQAGQNEFSGCGKLATTFRARVSATVIVTYHYCRSEPPTANDDGGITCQDRALGLNVLANDVAGTGQTLDCDSIELGPVLPAGAGTAFRRCLGLPACCMPAPGDCGSPHPDCTPPHDPCGGPHDVEFIPTPGFAGIATFTYTVADGAECRSNVATVTVTVLAPPITLDDGALTCRGEDVWIDVLANDLPGDRPIVPSTLQVVGTLDPSVGTASVVTGCPEGLGSGVCILFVPADNFVGVAEFQYTVRDSACCQSTATVRVEVLARPKVPPVRGEICQGDSFDVDLLAGRGTRGERGRGPSVELCNPPQAQYGIAEVVGSVLHYVPHPTACGVTETLYYRMTDEFGCSSDCTPIEITIHCNPIARPDFVIKQPGSSAPIWIDVLANDQAGTFPLHPDAPVKTSEPSHGQADRQPDGRFLYTPNSPFPGTDSFTYRIWDAFGCCAEAKVTITEECPTVVHHRRPASLLVFPMFDNRLGVVTVISVTHTGGSNLGHGNIQAHFVYREESDCSPFNRPELLTPKDTLTLITNAHAPDPVRGYVYVYARCPLTEQPVVSNTLVGQLLVVDGIESLSYSVNAFGYRGIGNPNQLDPVCNLPLTDLDGDGVRDLDNLEYELAPDQILIPRFIGQGGGFQSELVLIGLTGRAFSTTIDFLVYNDNEEVFSTEHTFRCWERTPLLSISGIFANTFLKTTAHAPLEILGAEQWESGWIRLDGGVAVSDLVSISDPAFLALLIERTPDGRLVADLPWEDCTQFGGALLRSSPLFD